MNTQRAIIKNEGTGDAPWFVYVERPYGGATHGGIRFNRRASAERVAATINRALEAEGRLSVYGSEQYA